jgi:hypothetical protein
MPIRAIVPAHTPRQKQKTGQAYRPGGCAHCPLVAAGILPAVKGGILPPGPALILSIIVARPTAVASIESPRSMAGNTPAHPCRQPPDAPLTPFPA